LELSLSGYDARYPILLVDLISEREVCPLEVARHVLEVVLDDQVSIAEFDAPAVLVARVSHLVMAMALLGIKSQVLSQIEQEGGVVAAGGELRGPPVGSIAADDVAGVAPASVIPAHRPVLLVRLHLKDNDVRLSHQVLLVLEGLEHGLDRMSALAQVSLGVDLHWLYSLLDYRVVRQVEVQYDFYITYNKVLRTYSRRRRGFVRT